ncbi:hypothetical protein [Ornithinimicrobium avium]|uniref:hypothetical protein n=1 Tax=Ornithinimicrobium avium TaxID=2283195 RepID=UPI0013B41B7C|nr:hypothetical protein [Ornithinimicrobium avium]
MTDTDRGGSRTQPVIILVVLAVVLFFVGRMAWQWFGAPEQERSGTLAEQLEALPGVADVRVESGRVPGAGGHQGVESWVTLDRTVLQDPQASAAGLAGVTWGYSLSHWTIEGLGSTAEVRYTSDLDPAPFAWWLQGVAALQGAAPGADLACDVRYGSLDCTVTGGDPAAARAALTAVDGSAVRAWVMGASTDPDQPHGFVLRVGGEEITDPGR